MKTHENRALFSKALLKATTCLLQESVVYGQHRKRMPKQHR